jgi:hypothetical protein
MKFKQYLTESLEKYAVLGVNDEQDVCDLCGKKGIKRVVWFSELNSEGERIGNPFATGVDCAAILMMQRQGQKKPPKSKMDAIWKAAQGISKAKELILKYSKDLEKLANMLRTKYPLKNVLVITHPVTNNPLGLIIYDAITKTQWSISVTGENRTWSAKKPENALRNWLRSRKGI